jgi:hypothetical protein
LEQTIRQVQDARLVVIDPVSAFLGGVDDHKNSEVRALLAPLAELAMRHALVVGLVTHLIKNASGRSLARVMGSLAYTAAARSVWQVTRDKDGPAGARRLFLPVKANLAPEASGLAFSIDRDAMRVVWSPEPIHKHADDVLTDPGGDGEPNPRALERARAFLREMVGERPVPASDVLAAAHEAGIAVRTLKRAKSIEGIDSLQTPDGWFWHQPRSADEGPALPAPTMPS